MEILKKSYKNGSKNWIAAWFIIYLSFFESFWSVRGNDETTMYSSGLEDTTTYQEPTTSYITITPLLSTAPTTLPISQDITSTTFLPSSALTFLTASTTVATTCHAQTEFIAWGPSSGDEIFPEGDDNFVLKCPSIDIPINSQNMGCFYIATNGYITNGETLPFTPNVNEVNQNQITLMPLWADIDTRFVGKIYYQVVDYYAEQNTQHITKNLDDIKNFFASSGKQNFNPVWALKITWDKVVPYNARVSDEELTFQFILATDGTSTQMAYMYDDCHMSWGGTNSAIMGYAYPGYSYYHRNSLFPDIFELGVQSNLQNPVKGVFTFELSAQYQVNHPQQCLEWKKISTVPDSNVVLSIRSCPCTEWQALDDKHYALGPNGCFYLIFPFQGYSKVCCYTTSQSIESLARGNVQLYSAILNQTLWRENDYRPYEECCLESDYCSIYNTYRPEDYCENYISPEEQFIFGDPHIETIDGYRYTFNGLGEFELLDVYNAANRNQNLMKIQCRTKEVGTNGRRATAFSAFVIRSENVDIQVSTRESMEAFKIFGNGIELTTFYKNESYVWNQSPFRVSSEQGTNYSLIISHTSQTTIGIRLRNSILQLSINLGYEHGQVKTNGLLGTYNKNITDDLETPTGTFISINSTEEEIYYNFGMLWKVNNSIFHYESGESRTSSQNNFVPSFLKIDKTSAVYKDALTVCTPKESDCIYDYIITQDKALAQNTKEVEKAIAYNKLLQGIKAPILNGSKTMTVNINETAVHVINIESTNNNLTLDIIEGQNCNISISQKKVNISVTITKVEPVKAAFQVIDSYRLATPLFNLTVTICPHCENGRCNTSVVNPIKHYEHVCDCDKGWRGPNCNMDARCEPLNCTCTGPNNNYTCDCPPGYAYVQKCKDIDECLSNATNNCSQICTNTIGSYRCSCNKGYTLVNQTECVNLNECDLSLHNCDHLCNDVDGSFNCSCYPGYKLNGTTCIQETDLCKGTVKCKNATGCTVVNGNTTCFCNNGYMFNETTSQCEDINECDNIACPNGYCVNSEGSYACKCPAGRKLTNDGRTCEACGHNKWGENCANTCSGANCISCNARTGCVCTSGFKGTTCDDDINECAEDSNYCNTTISTCRNTVGSASCVCNIGFRLDATGKCIDIDECTESNDCSTYAVCTNNIGSHTCKCREGFIGDGKNCTDKNECAEKNACEHTCVNQIGSFSCICNSNYKLQDDRFTCKKEIGPSNKEEMYAIIFGSIAGAIVAGLLLTLWIYCFGCCACCPCACLRRRRRRRHFLSTLEQDQYNVRSAFGSITSSLRGRLVRDEPFSSGSTMAGKYLEDWGDFSPYSENNRQDIREYNLSWNTYGEGSSSWGNIFDHFDNSREFRIERPKVRP